MSVSDFLSTLNSFRAILKQDKPDLYFSNRIAIENSHIIKEVLPPIQIEVKKMEQKPIISPKQKQPPVELKPLKVEKELTPPAGMHAQFRKLFPNLFLHKDPLDDRKAKQIKNGWKIKSRLIDVPIFATKELTPYLPLLNNIAKAIDASFVPSRVIQIEAIESKDVWDTLLDPNYIKLILCPDVILWSSKALLNHYKQQPLKSIQKLGQIDLIVLPDLSLYIKDPLLKQALWNMLCHYFG
jgi:hypothetical protein